MTTPTDEKSTSPASPAVEAVELVGSDGRCFLVRRNAIVAACWQDGRLVMLLEGGHVLPLRDDYGRAIISAGPFGEAAFIMNVKVTRLHPGDIYNVRNWGTDAR